MQSKANSYHIVLLILGIGFIVLYFSNLSSTCIFDPGESRYAETAREMIESGNYIVPYCNYKLRLEKPVLFYWLEVLSMKTFGINEFAVRLPSALSGLLCAGMVFILIRTVFSLTPALLSSIILMSSFMFALASRVAVTDMTLCSFITSSIISFYLYYHSAKEQNIKPYYWNIIGFIFLALGALTKGPVAILITGMVLFPFLLLSRRLILFLKAPSFWIGFLIFLVITLPWYIAVHFATNGEFTNKFFLVQNFGRYTSVVSGHQGNIFSYIPVLTVGFLPWSLFLLQSVFDMTKNIQSDLNNNHNQFKLFCLWWFAAIFLFFSFSKTQLPSYILPVYPSVSILVSLWLTDIIKDNKTNKSVSIGLALLSLIGFATLAIFIVKPGILIKKNLLKYTVSNFAFLLTSGLLVGYFYAFICSIKNTKKSILVLISLVLISLFYSSAFLIPHLNKNLMTLKGFAESIPSNVEIIMFNNNKPILSFYAKRKIHRVNKKNKLEERLNSKKYFAFVINKKDVKELNLNTVHKLSDDNNYEYYINFPPSLTVTK